MNWRRERFAEHPVISIDQNPAETISQYVPAPVLLESGEIWVYVKGDATGNISAYRSLDGGRNFQFVDVALDRGPPGTWDTEYVHEPVAVFDEATATIHLWYKGTTERHLFGRWQWGHATAPASTPWIFTKDPLNPILSYNDIEDAFDIEGVHDVAVSDVVRAGATTLFYGYFGSSSGYRMFVATGSTWNDPVPARVIMAPTPPHDLVQCPNVIRQSDNVWYMIYTSGFDADHEASLGRVLRVARSSDGINWATVAGTFFEPQPSISWERKRVYCASILKDHRTGFLRPARVEGQGLLYYSGSSLEHRDQVGLLLLR